MARDDECAVNMYSSWRESHPGSSLLSSSIAASLSSGGESLSRNENTSGGSGAAEVMSVTQWPRRQRQPTRRYRYIRYGLGQF